ncbi:uncharacterized protein LOC107273723 [Cephus cinctus]|uniref:Uncharacterized protein LOC107273723 n=1 Tax=Cephus cinctus TaxID=211228 RepID=A0AAJ7FTN3_CEPCN|nr:uncharacterized protein LOC107273723 [Cephus cinctus]XP_015607703.1 uncharacterized protein LOC107273723 [Cephus cinctus]XP_015607704.1 uncharacterized protein LOC107273723 [Cephus cinctus]
MSTQLFLFLCSVLIAGVINYANGAVMVREVSAGHLAELPCLSSDDYHRFMFWELKDNQHIISPGNPHDSEKYNYEVLTGKLFIRGVSTAESGFYKCVSRGIADTSVIKIHVVELVVRKDSEDVWENNFETNLLRSMAAVTVIVLAVAIVLFIVIMKRRKNHHFFEMQESRENSPARYNPKVQNVPSTEVPTSVESRGIDNVAMDVDFPKVFKLMQKEQAIP